MKHRGKIIGNAQIRSFERMLDEAETMVEVFKIYMEDTPEDSVATADVQQYWALHERDEGTKFTAEEREAITYAAGKLMELKVQGMEAAFRVEQIKAKTLAKAFVSFAARSAGRRQRKQRKGIIRDLLKPTAPVSVTEEK